jgi:hypothetical protein
MLRTKDRVVTHLERLAGLGLFLGQGLAKMEAEAKEPTEQLYLSDTYMFMCEARVVSVEALEGNKYAVYLDRTVFHPQVSALRAADRPEVRCGVPWASREVGSQATWGTSCQPVRDRCVSVVSAAFNAVLGADDPAAVKRDVNGAIAHLGTFDNEPFEAGGRVSVLCSALAFVHVGPKGCSRRGCASAGR